MNICFFYDGTNVPMNIDPQIFFVFRKPYNVLPALQCCDSSLFVVSIFAVLSVPIVVAQHNDKEKEKEEEK